MERIKRLFTKDWGYKLLSILIAVVLWFIVINIENPVETRKYTIRINAENVSYLNNSGIVITNMQEIERASITVTVKGERVFLDRLSQSPEDITAVADFNAAFVDLEAGCASVPIEVFLPAYAGSSLEIINKSSKSLDVDIQEHISIEMKVDVNVVGEPSEGYFVDEPYVYPKTVIVSGARADVENAKSVNAYVSVEGLEEDISVHTDLAVYDEKGNRALNVELSRDEADVSIYIKRLKSIKVRSITSGIVPEGYEVVSMTVTPENVEVIGYESDLEKVSEVDIPVINLRDITKSITKKYLVDDLLPEGIKAKDPDEEITVDIIVKHIAEKTLNLSTGDIVINGELGPGLKANFPEESVYIAVKGDFELVETLTAENVFASVDVEGLRAGTHLIVLDIELPEGVEMTSGQQAVIISITER